jgi:GAF domain-containing protein
MSLLKALSPYQLPKSVLTKSPLDIQHEIVLQHLLNAVTGFAVLGLLLYLARTPINASNIGLILPFVITIAFQLLITLSRRWKYNLRAGLLVLLLASECLAALSSLGLNGTALIYAIALVAVTSVLFSSRAGIVILTALVVIFAINGWLMYTGHIPIPRIASDNLVALSSSWINILLAFLLTTASLIGAFHQLSSGLSGALTDQKALTDQLNKERGLLEIRVTDRTEELTHKTRQLEASRHVSSYIARETHYDMLLKVAASTIKEQFKLDRTAIFLAAANQGIVELRASSSDEYQRLLPALQQQYPLDGSDPISRSAFLGEPFFSSQIETPDKTPDSQPASGTSELIVAIKSVDKIIGVILLQASDADALRSQDVDVFTTLADQLALGLEKSMLLNRLEQSLKSLEENYRRTTQKSWNIHLKGTRHKYAYRYTQNQILPNPSRGEAAARALQIGSTVIANGNSPDQPEHASTNLAVPIKLRNQTLGVINLRINASHISPELVMLVESAVNRLSISLENARLLEEIQSRADRERLVGEIATKVRAATDIESILYATASELGRSLGVAEVVVQLNKMK